MREILFKAKRRDNGEWVEGFYARIYDSKGNVSHRIYPGYAESDCGEFYPEWFEVDPDTVGQYIVCDKNGKRIFEGDIIKGDNGYISAIMQLEYGSYRPDMFFTLYENAYGYIPSQNLYGFFLESKTEQMLVVDSPYMEVIGNKWDNPELLEGEG